ncbi:MAG TPA: hypothetical protein VGE74_19040 [Gemmata sp.]
MRKVALVSAAGALLGYAAVYFAFFAKPEPAPAPEAPVAEAPAEPVVLANVVDVTDTEPLLDSRPTETPGAPFDPQVVPAAFTTPASAQPIPPAAD